MKNQRKRRQLGRKSNVDLSDVEVQTGQSTIGPEAFQKIDKVNYRCSAILSTNFDGKNNRQKPPEKSILIGTS
ncbi:MAG: hypothetical protein ABJL11_02860 [Parasphingorhabdus sp.]